MAGLLRSPARYYAPARQWADYRCQREGSLISFIAPSIQLKTSLLISDARRPLGSIAGPITTLIVPGHLMKLCFGQYSPALWAIGIIGKLLFSASIAPPILYLCVSPGAVRVPSGNKIIHLPSLSFSVPSVINCLSASLPAPRLIAIGSVNASAQPKIGIRTSSRLKTQRTNGVKECSASVSHVD